LRGVFLRICVFGILKGLIPSGSRDGYEWEKYLNGMVTRTVVLSLAGGEKRKYVVCGDFTALGLEA
jgi:hypothetical protein